MAWLPIIDEDEATGLLQDTYRKAKRRSGRVFQILKVSSLLPKVVDAYIGLYQTLMLGSSGLSRAEREMIATVTSSENDCFY